MAEEKLGIKELKEAVRALRVLAVGGASILEEGLEAEDLQDAVAVVKRYDKIVEGFKGLGQVVPEAKDLDMLEITELLAEVKMAVDDVKSALGGTPAEELLAKLDA